MVFKYFWTFSDIIHMERYNFLAHNVHAACGATFLMLLLNTGFSS